MPFVPSALVTSAVAAPYFVVAALCGRVLSRDCFGFCALAVGTQVLGRVPFMGCVAYAPFQHRSLTPQSSGTPRWCASPLTFDVMCKRRTMGNMILDENNHKEKINSFTHQDWHPLIELIPQIESTSKFGEMAGGEKDEKGIIQFPYCIQAPIVAQFLEIVYSLPIIISFDWGAWEAGRKIASDKDFDTLDVPTKCKLITAIVRNDRFCEGALVSAFESGLILKILKSIEKQI